jgi:hypothetical protein
VQHPRRHRKIARLIGKAEALVGLERIEPLILQAIGAQLVDEADPAPLLAQIEQHAPAAARARLVRHGVERGIELGAAIAFEAAEDVAGEALRMEPHQRRTVAALLADDERDMLAQIGL